jgi:molybdenum cofactor synthesis domain-containing protein
MDAESGRAGPSGPRIKALAPGLCLLAASPVHMQVAMTAPPADQSSIAPREAVTAALLVIGDEILSGRTKDKNIGYIAEYLTAVGIDLKEVRVVGDEESAIVDALNALRHRYSYVFTTGGIGPTHDDITADCVAKAFGVSIDVDPRALAIMKERLAATGTEMNEARMRMTRIPKGADLVINKVSGAPGIWIGNVIVLAGVPSIMQAMLDEVAPRLRTGVRMLSETVRADAREGDIGSQLGEIAKANPEVAIGSYPFFDPQHGPNTNVVLRARDAGKLAAAKRAVEDMLERVRRVQSSRS